MKPPVFAYHAPSTVAEALDVLGAFGDDARVLAGGQSLIPMMNLRLVRPANLVDLGRVMSLRGVARTASGLRIGAMTLQRDLEESADARRHCPLLIEATSLIGHAEIRNRGTVGGNVAHADPASELPAALLALGATMRLESRRGERVVPSDAFFVDAFTTAAGPEEILTAIDVPDVPDGTGAAFVEYSRRHGDFALVGVSALATVTEDRTISRARIVLSGVGPVPWRCVNAEVRLEGTRVDSAALRAAADAAAEDVHPDDDVHASAEYRRQLARVLVARALSVAVGRAEVGDARAS